MASWEVVDQVPNQYGPTVGGNPVLGVEVLFITGKGNRSSVWVSNDRYNEANVRAEISKKAAVVDGVGGLKHTE